MCHYVNVSTRLLVASLAFSLFACGGMPEGQSTLEPSQSSLSLKKRDTGEAPPVDPAPSSMEKQALDLRVSSDSGDIHPLAAAFSYSTSFTNSATVNTADFYFTLSAGTTITLGTCGVNGASGSGDTYLRFFDPSGVQVAVNDDACGALSNFSYTVPVSGTYLLRAGCFGNTACSGTVGYAINAVVLTYSTSFTNSATVNTANVYFNLSAGTTITLGTCGVSGASGSGDTYLRFYNPSGLQVAFNDDACGLLSNFSYTVPVSGTYMLAAGCFGSGACSGTVATVLQ
jgi:hypothetical protein